MQGLININGRQRIILVSNMPESENDNEKQYSIDSLSANHPNAVFFTEKKEYNGENIGNNIWMGGVNFTRVHGVDPNACSVRIGDEIITLVFDPETGLISLQTGEKINTIYVGVNPFWINNSYINLNDSSLSEQNIENLLFNNRNLNTFTCENYEDMCSIVNNTSSDTEIKYVPQGFDQITQNENRNLFIVLPTIWVRNIFVSEKRETNENIEVTNGDTTVYLKSSTITTQVGKYSIIKTVGSIVDPNNVLLLPVTKWKEITI